MISLYHAWTRSRRSEAWGCGAQRCATFLLYKLIGPALQGSASRWEAPFSRVLEYFIKSINSRRAKTCCLITHDCNCIGGRSIDFHDQFVSLRDFIAKDKVPSGHDRQRQEYALSLLALSILHAREHRYIVQLTLIPYSSNASVQAGLTSGFDITGVLIFLSWILLLAMDPLTIVSLVSNIIQLVDAAISAATKCHEIYKLGAPKDDLHLASVTEQLSQCYTTLNSSLQVRSVLKSLSPYSRVTKLTLWPEPTRR